MAATPLLMLLYAAMRNVGYTTGGRRLSFVDFIIPSVAAFAASHLLQGTMVAVAASYRARGVLRRLAGTPYPLVWTRARAGTILQDRISLDLS